MTDPAYLMNDISDYQRQFDANRYARTGRRAVMIKACEGESWVAGGVNHRARVIAAHRAHLRVVHYAFIRAGSAAGQAQTLLKQLDGVWEDGDVLCADIEDSTFSESGARILLEGWCAELKAHGHEHPIGYSGRAYLQERSQLVTAGTIRGWIVADYPYAPTHASMLIIGAERRASRKDIDACRPKPCFGKQFTDGMNGPLPHTCYGISGPVDCTELTAEGYAWIVEHK